MTPADGMQLAFFIGIVLFCHGGRNQHPDWRFEKRGILPFLSAEILAIVGISMFIKYNFDWYDLTPTVDHTHEHHESIEKLKNMSWWVLFGVFFEDAVFVSPILLVNKRFRIPAAVMLSIAFMLGHLYQGLGSGLPKALYVPIAAYFAHRYGIYTTMVAHVLQDIFAIGMVKYYLH